MFSVLSLDTATVTLKLASFKEEQLPYRAAIHVGAAVLAQVARSRRSEPLLDERSLCVLAVSNSRSPRDPYERLQNGMLSFFGYICYTIRDIVMKICMLDRETILNQMV